MLYILILLCEFHLGYVRVHPLLGGSPRGVRKRFPSIVVGCEGQIPQQKTAEQQVNQLMSILTGHKEPEKKPLIPKLKHSQ